MVIFHIQMHFHEFFQFLESKKRKSSDDFFLAQPVNGCAISRKHIVCSFCFCDTRWYCIILTPQCRWVTRRQHSGSTSPHIAAALYYVILLYRNKFIFWKKWTSGKIDYRKKTRLDKIDWEKCTPNKFNIILMRSPFLTNDFFH